MEKPMMKCGHVANGSHGCKPCCVICIGIRRDKDGRDLALEPQETPPELTGRMAKCASCNSEMPSGTGLAFFFHKPNAPKDEYYCGCKGWD